MSAVDQEWPRRSDKVCPPPAARFLDNLAQAELLVAPLPTLPVERAPLACLLAVSRPRASLFIGAHKYPLTANVPYRGTKILEFR